MGAYIGVDTKSGWIPRNYAGGESITFPNGVILKSGNINVVNSQVVTFGTPFPGGIREAVTVLGDTGPWAAAIETTALTVNNFNIDLGGVGTAICRWFAIGW